MLSDAPEQIKESEHMPKATLRAFGIFVCAAGLAALAGCTTTKLSEAWVDSSYTGGPVESVLVVGLSDNVRRRGLFEDELTSRFKGRGVSAVASRGVAPDIKGLDEESFLKKAQDLGIRTVIVTKLLSAKKEQYYVPGQPQTPSYSYGGGFAGYYDRAYGRDYYAGYWAEYEVIELETNLYEVATGKVVWSAASETIDPRSVDKVVQKLSQKIIDDLAKRGLLAQ